MATQIEKLEQELNVDVDWMAPEFIDEIYKIVPNFKFNDQTSNQLWVNIQLHHESNADILKQACKDLKAEGWLAIYTRVAAQMCKKNIGQLKGRVLLQTLPSKAYDFDATLAHGRLYAKEFNRAGITNDRFQIKIPSTGPGLNAAKILESEGIRTLGTALFGVPQAIACSQAGCLSISPYFNETVAHDIPGLWPKSADPSVQHPNSNRCLQILDIYRRLYKETGKAQPLIKNASYISVEEALASGEHGYHSATISPQLLKKLATTPYVKGARVEGAAKPANPLQAYANRAELSSRLKPLLDTDPLSWEGKVQYKYEEIIKVDYLANNGKLLDEAVEKDPVARRRIDDALRLFTGAEKESQKKIEEVLASL